MSSWWIDPFIIIKCTSLSLNWENWEWGEREKPLFKYHRLLHFLKNVCGFFLNRYFFHWLFALRTISWDVKCFVVFVLNMTFTSFTGDQWSSSCWHVRSWSICLFLWSVCVYFLIANDFYKPHETVIYSYLFIQYLPWCLKHCKSRIPKHFYFGHRFEYWNFLWCIWRY